MTEAHNKFSFDSKLWKIGNPGESPFSLGVKFSPNKSGGMILVTKLQTL
jgi:hypothetical protein